MQLVVIVTACTALRPAGAIIQAWRDQIPELQAGVPAAQWLKNALEGDEFLKVQDGRLILKAELLKTKVQLWGAGEAHELGLPMEL